MVNFLITLLVGAVAGWLAGMIMGMNGGLLRNIIVGLVGGFIGGALFNLLGIGGGSLIYSILTAVVGACILLFAAKKLLKESTRKFTAPELSFRWLWDQEGVSVILSGMNSIEMIDENIKTASDAKSGDLTAEDFELVDKVKKIIKEKELVGCTGCRYCMPCPKGVDIPGNFFFYNLTALDGKTAARFEYARAIGVRKDPAFASQCIGCGKCEKHCPQHLPIREMLKKADKALRPLPYKVGINVARKIMLKG